MKKKKKKKITEYIILTKKHFKLFKDTCEYWISRLSISGWAVYYRFEILDGVFATSQCRREGRVSSLILNKRFYSVGIPNISDKIRGSAKHEVLHLFLARLAGIGESRFVTEKEFDEANEEMVIKLEKLIKGIRNKESLRRL